MFPKMEEVIISAFMIELANRSISFLINKWSKLMTLNNEEMMGNLQRLLLRVGAIIDEAEGRRIISQAMLHQLHMMRKEMYRGYYMLDTYLCQDHEGDKAKGDEAGQYFTLLSRINPAKRLCIRSGNSENRKELMRVLGNLETALQDAAEFIKLSGRYSRIPRQPYNMYYFLDNCMFGRQMEMEHVFNFLFQTQSPSADHLGVLPIIGPPTVGKSTLMEHACIDERVRSHFSRIVLLTEDDLRGEDMVTLEDGGVIKYDNRTFSGGKVLIIIELYGDFDDSLWQRMQYLTPEAFWYFFKVRLFGSIDMTDHPKLASLAMDMARELKCCFMGANILIEMLKSNFDIPLWNLALATRRILKQKNPLLCDLHHRVDPSALTKPLIHPIAKRTSTGHMLVHNIYQTVFSQNGTYGLTASSRDTAAPMVVTLKDLIFGSARPQGKNFDALAWRSHIPPHYNCMFKCELKIPETGHVSRKKRTSKISN
ncbi:unnamed protein product [Urochloa humidicola]